MSGEDELEASTVSFIPCLTWVRRGVAKPEPEKVQLTKEELMTIIKQTKGDLKDFEAAEEGQGSGEEEEEVEPTAESGATSKPTTHKSKSDTTARDDKDIIDEYGLDDYDEDDEKEESVKKLLGIGELTTFADPSEDPYLDPRDPDEDQEDLEDFLIRGTDNLILVGHVEGDCPSLEVYIYNDTEDALYVHHDILLPSFPLALEWLSFDPESDTKGSLVAIGTMLPQIQVWDLDIVDCLEPAFTLGVKASKKKGIKRVGHKDAVLSLAWNQGVEHVLASGSVDQTVMIWDLNQKNVASTLKYHEEKVQSLAWHPFDHQTLATGCCDKMVRVADCRSQDSFKKWRVTGEVESVKWNHFNPYQCIASTDAGTVHCIDVRKDSPLWTLSAHTEEVTGISLSSQCPGCLVTVSADKSMKVWDILNDKPEMVMERQPSLGFLQSLSGCPDAPFVVAMGGDNPADNFRVFDVRENIQVRQRFGNRKLENPMNFSAFGFATANEAEPAETMDAESAADVLQSMSLQPTTSTTTTAAETSVKPSGGAAAKFKKKDKKKKKHN